MSKIKKFFSRKKEEAAFKLQLGGGFGQGHTLNEQKSEPSTTQNSRNAYVPPKRKRVSAAARAAAAAALARIDNKNSKDFNKSLAAIKLQAKRELEAERKTKKEPPLANETESDQTVAESVRNRNLACQGVFFRCSLISDEVLPKKEWKSKIKTFLYEQLEEDKALTASLIIYSLNTKEKAEECIQIITKYLENIINHPDEEKYCRIRMSNKIFIEKVRHVEGAVEFLTAAGFQIETDNQGENVLVWHRDKIEVNFDLQTLCDVLKTAEPISLELDRNIKVLLPSQARRVVLPDDFYRISPEEIKREQQLRAQANESAQVLKTRAMREREEQRNQRMYRYALIRVKFANGLFIQGTFNVYEKISDVFEFVQSCLQDELLEFNLISPSEGKISDADMDKTLYEMRFIPNILLLFALPGQTVAEAADTNFLKEELLMLVQSI